MSQRAACLFVFKDDSWSPPRVRCFMTAEVEQHGVHVDPQGGHWSETLYRLSDKTWVLCCEDHTGATRVPEARKLTDGEALIWLHEHVLDPREPLPERYRALEGPIRPRNVGGHGASSPGSQGMSLIPESVPDPVFLFDPSNPGVFWQFFPDETEVRGAFCREIEVDGYPVKEHQEVHHLPESGEWLLRRSYTSDHFESIRNWPSDGWNRITTEEALALLARHGWLTYHLRHGADWLAPYWNFILNGRNLGLAPGDRNGLVKSLAPEKENDEGQAHKSDEQTATGFDAGPWDERALADEQRIPRLLLGFMQHRRTASLDDVAKAVWCEDESNVTENARKSALRKANEFLRRQGCRMTLAKDAEAPRLIWE